jgi:hypothetical protein
MYGHWRRAQAVATTNDAGLAEDSSTPSMLGRAAVIPSDQSTAGAAGVPYRNRHAAPCCSAIGTEIRSGLNVREPKMDDFAEQE